MQVEEFKIDLEDKETQFKEVSVEMLSLEFTLVSNEIKKDETERLIKYLTIDKETSEYQLGENLKV
jgi:hypothetical protein